MSSNHSTPPLPLPPFEKMSWDDLMASKPTTTPFTPMTAQIRDVFLLGALDVNPDIELDTGEVLAMFDRWLAAHDADIRAEALEAAAMVADSISAEYVQYEDGSFVEADVSRAASDIATGIRAMGTSAHSEWLSAVKADAWDEARSAPPQFLGPDNGHYNDCLGWEDCHCDTYPNPYRKATL
jgi:hypothetical protein